MMRVRPIYLELRNDKRGVNRINLLATQIGDLWYTTRDTKRVRKKKLKAESSRKKTIKEICAAYKRESKVTISRIERIIKYIQLNLA